MRAMLSFPDAAAVPRPPAPLAEAILRTLLYADVFEYALTPAEIHRFLIGAAAAPEAVAHTLADCAWLAERVERRAGYITVRGRGPLAAVRAERARHSARLWPAARRWAARLSGLPFVRLVAVTGALAVDNATAGDDIDYLIVTEPGRVWLARALVVAGVRLARLGGVRLCPNYVLARSALAQSQRDLYIAHDLYQMVPLAGHALYAEMQALNAWARAYLPQAASGGRAEADQRPRGGPRALQQLGEWLLGGRLGDALEAWERARKLRKFGPAAHQPGSAARLDAERVKGHFEDHGSRVLAQYHHRLAQFGLAPMEDATAALK